MIVSRRREILTYDQFSYFFYRITNSLAPDYGDSCFDGPGLKISMNRMEKAAWMEFCAKHAQFNVVGIGGEELSDEAYAELLYLILTEKKTGYKVLRVDTSYNELYIYFRNSTLNNLFSDGNRYLTDSPLPDDFTVTFSMEEIDKDFRLFFAVKAPRPERHKDGRRKWRKFRIGLHDGVFVEEYGKKHYRKVQFLKPTEEQKAAEEQPVEIYEHEL